MLTKSEIWSPATALTWLAYPSMSPAFCGVVTHQAWPGLAFSATMAGETGMVTPSTVPVVGPATVVDVDGPFALALDGGAAVAGLGPLPATAS